MTQGLRSQRLKELTTHVDRSHINSFYLLTSSIIMSVLGFGFWAICTRLYTPEQIGIATALLAGLNLVTSLSLLGFEISLIRILPTHPKKSELFNTYLTITSVIGLFLAVLFLAVQPFIAAELSILHSGILVGVLFVAFTLVSISSYLVESALIAYTQAKYVFYKSIIFGLLKLPLPFVFLFLGAFGVYSAWMASLLAAVAYSMWVLQKRFDHRLWLRINPAHLKGTMRYSFFNYIAAFIEGAPIMVLPLLITAVMGPTQNAYYYMTMTIANVLFMIPISAAQSLFAEGAQAAADTAAKLRRAIVFMSALLLPAIAATFVLGPFVLGIFGEDYANNGAWALNIFAVSAIPMAVSTVCRTLLKLKFKSGLIVAIDCIGAAVIISFAYLFSNQQLNGIALAWLYGQIVLMLCFGLIAWQSRLRSRLN
jgi:O-antigen/teichoic acid export membrane protein